MSEEEQQQQMHLVHLGNFGFQGLLDMSSLEGEENDLELIGTIDVKFSENDSETLLFEKKSSNDNNNIESDNATNTTYVEYIYDTWKGQLTSTLSGKRVVGELTFNRKMSRSGYYQFTGSAVVGDYVYTFNTCANGLTAVTKTLTSDFSDEISINDRTATERNEGKMIRRRSLLRRNLQVMERPVAYVVVGYTQLTMCTAAMQPPDCPYNDTNKEPIENLINLAITETNEAYDASGLDLTMKLASTIYEADFNELDTSIFSIPFLLADPTDGILDKIQAARKYYGAQYAALIVEDATACGISKQFTGNPNDSVIVVARRCATGYFSFCHEIAHIQGCEHDRATELATNTTLYPETFYGYLDPEGRFRSIMAYDCPPNIGSNDINNPSCPRVKMFSTPNIKYTFEGQEEPIGTPFDNCAGTIDDNWDIIAATDNPRFLPGTCKNNNDCKDPDIESNPCLVASCIDNSCVLEDVPCPTPSPTPLSCGSDQATFMLNILFDNYPEDVGWNLTRTCDNTTVLSESPGFYTMDLVGKTASVLQCVDSAEYTFTIIDSYGDALCCAQGQGGYMVEYNGITVASGDSDYTFNQTSSPFGEQSCSCLESRRDCQLAENCFWEGGMEAGCSACSSLDKKACREQHSCVWESGMVAGCVGLGDSDE